MVTGNIKTTNIAGTLSYGVSKEYVDDNFVHISGDTMTGNLKVDATLRVGDDINNFSVDRLGRVTLMGDARSYSHVIMPAGTFKLIGLKQATINIEGVFITLDFIYTSQHEAYSKGFVPFRWDNTSDIEMTLGWMCDEDASGAAVCWGIEYLSIKAGEIVANGVSTTIVEAFTGETAGRLQRSVFTTPILHTKLEADDILGIRIYRDHDNIDDTLNNTARFLSLHLKYLHNKLGMEI